MLSALYRTIESEEKVGVGETQGSVGDTKTKKERGGGEEGRCLGGEEEIGSLIKN